MPSLGWAWRRCKGLIVQLRSAISWVVCSLRVNTGRNKKGETRLHFKSLPVTLTLPSGWLSWYSFWSWSLSLYKTPSEWKHEGVTGKKWVKVKFGKLKGRLKRSRNKKMKSRGKKKVSGPSLSPALLLTLTLSASWLHVFTNYSGMQKGAVTRRSGIHLHSYWFVLLLLSFFSSRTESKMEFQGAKKKQSRNLSSNKIPEWASHRDPYGCRAVVMSLSAHLLWLPSCL